MLYVLPQDGEPAAPAGGMTRPADHEYAPRLEPVLALLRGMRTLAVAGTEDDESSAAKVVAGVPAAAGSALALALSA